MRRSWALATACAFGLAVLSGLAGERERNDEKKVTLDQVPPAVKATILREAKRAKIQEIEKETKKGKTVYEAEWAVDGKVVEIQVAPDGKLLSRKLTAKEKLTLDQVPPAVKATIVREAKGAKIQEIEKETKKGKTVYEAEWMVDGKEVEIRVAPNGTLLKNEAEDEDDNGEHGEGQQGDGQHGDGQHGDGQQNDGQHRDGQHGDGEHHDGQHND